MFPAAVQRPNCVPWMQIRTNPTIDNVLLPCVSQTAGHCGRHVTAGRGCGRSTIALTIV